MKILFLSRYKEISMKQARIQKFFKGRVEEENFLLIHVSTRVHIKFRQTCNSFSLLPFQEDCPLFFALFYYSFLFLKFEKGVATTVTPLPPPIDPPMWNFDPRLYSPIFSKRLIKFQVPWSVLHSATLEEEGIFIVPYTCYDREP